MNLKNNKYENSFEIHRKLDKFMDKKLNLNTEHSIYSFFKIVKYEF